MPETNCAAALTASERLRAAVEAHPWHELAPGFTVTLSIGVADDKGCDGPEELLRRADTRLYQAKAQGRNRVATVDGER